MSISFEGGMKVGRLLEKEKINIISELIQQATAEKVNSSWQQNKAILRIQDYLNQVTIMFERKINILFINEEELQLARQLIRGLVNETCCILDRRLDEIFEPDWT